MDWSSGALALAWIEEEILLFIMVLKAYFTGIILGLSAKDEIHNILVEKRFWIFHLFLAFLDSIKELADIVLNTTKFKRHSRDYVI